VSAGRSFDAVVLNAEEGSDSPNPRSIGVEVLRIVSPDQRKKLNAARAARPTPTPMPTFAPVLIGARAAGPAEGR